jgi:hypothetical protein
LFLEIPKPQQISDPDFLVSQLVDLLYTVQTVAADLRRGEHIPKMQNNIGRKSTLRKLRQLRSKDGGEGGEGGGCWIPCRAGPRGARPIAGFCTTALNLSRIEFGEFGSGIAKTTRWARSKFLQIYNLPLYQLRHTSLVVDCSLDTALTILYSVLYYTILYYTILYYTILYYTILYYT